MTVSTDWAREAMRAALDLARRGSGRVSPNPMVGAILMHRGRILACGFHRRFGGPHAERDLLRDLAGRRVPPDSVLFLTLEPCTHVGKTPPCCDALLDSPIRNFEIAMLDPDPRVRGRGAAALRKAGRRVRVGRLADEARELLLPFLRAQREGRASVRLKLASTMDGMLCDASGRSRWITGPAARREVHRARRACDAVVLGAGTVEADDPRIRFGDSEDRLPSRIVISRALRFDPDCRLARIHRREARASRDAVGERIGNWMRLEAGGRSRRWIRVPRLVAATSEPSLRRRELFRRAGWEIWDLPVSSDGVDLPSLARRARQEGLIDLLVEAGPTLAAGFLDAGPVDRILLYLAPRLLPGGRHWSAGAEAVPLSSARRLRLRFEPLPGGDRRVEVAGVAGAAIVSPRSRRMR